MKTKLIVLLFISASLTNCGFGGSGADPLKDRDDTFVSRSEKEQNEKDIEARYEEETAKNEATIAQLKQQTAADQEEMKKTKETLQAQLDAALASSDATHKQRIASMQTTLDENISRTNQTIENLVASADLWERQSQMCEAEIERIEKESHREFNYQFDVEGANAQYIELESNQEINPENAPKIFFKLFLGSEFLQNVTFEGLPPGLRFVPDESDENLWVLQGTPDVEVEAGQTFEAFTVTLKPHFATVTEPDLAGKLSSDSLSQTVNILIKKSSQRPEIVDIDLGSGATTVISIVVNDPAIVDAGEAPGVSFLGRVACTRSDNSTCSNAASIVTLDTSVENPTRVSGGWKYSYKVHQGLLGNSDLCNSNNNLDLSVVTQSRVSGLVSDNTTFTIEKDDRRCDSTR